MYIIPIYRSQNSTNNLFTASAAPIVVVVSAHAESVTTERVSVGAFLRRKTRATNTHTAHYNIQHSLYRPAIRLTTIYNTLYTDQRYGSLQYTTLSIQTSDTAHYNIQHSLYRPAIRLTTIYNTLYMMHASNGWQQRMIYASFYVSLTFDWLINPLEWLFCTKTM